MEVLINGLIKAGAVRHRLEAKIFGGANVLNGLSDIGAKNAEFAERFLASEGFPIVGKDLGGFRPRRIAFWPTTGRVRLLAISCNTVELAGQELRASRAQIVQRDAGDVELF
jgi:chemotaxis protein CheD